VEQLPRRKGEFAEPGEPLSGPLRQLLAARGIERLYSHQVAALEAARRGRHLVVVTGTASGKTLCYNVPILEACLSDSHARALYLFPTKALAQDQAKGLSELLSENPEVAAQVRAGVYDGDTPTSQRRRIKAEANLVLSNPDMLHASILPYHPKWARFLSDLKFVVLDEVHTYRGILGANVACVLRRLMRVCEHYGSRPVFLAASATIANPGELTSRLLGVDVDVIDQDGAPRGSKYFALWNPTPLGCDSLARRSATDDAVWLMVEALEAGAQAMAFTRTRQAAELVNRYVQDELHERRSKLADSIRAYRGGYLPNERRQIEQDLFSGRLRGVATTNALELGVDIGSLDVTFLVHYPGTIASAWQQAGRSGRRHEESLAVMLAGNDPIDQYLLRHPDYFFSQSPENAAVDPENPYVLANHLKAAAFELPLDGESTERFGATAPAVTEILCDARELTDLDGKIYFAGGQNPAQRISLRHMADNTFSIVLCRDKTGPGGPNRPIGHSTLTAARGDAAAVAVTTPPTARGRREMPQGHEVIANVDAISAPELVYPEAVYLHNGESYFVRRLDLEGKVAYVERHEMDYYTQAVLDSNVVITREADSRALAETERDLIAATAKNPTNSRTQYSDGRKLPAVNSATVFPDNIAMRGDRVPSHEFVSAARLAYGDVEVSWKTVAFKKIKFTTRENIGFGSVDLPAQSLTTTAFWLTPDDAMRAAMKQQRLRPSEGLCGLRNLAVVALPMVAMCDSRDLSGVVDSKNLGKSTMIVYDRYPGGLGYSQKGFQCIGQLLDVCLEMISQCECEEGCPSCVGLPNLRPAIHSDPDLMRGYPIPNKAATLLLLQLLTWHGLRPQSK
jgi:DEAD/DEAH box helicase domain-containing protein